MYNTDLTEYKFTIAQQPAAFITTFHMTDTVMASRRQNQQQTFGILKGKEAMRTLTPTSLMYSGNSTGGHHEYVDEKPLDQQEGSRLPNEHRYGMELSYLHSDDGKYLCAWVWSETW
ncbi:hypothetical protein AVEN_183404-1 [Araneus ventricosus]|uniref:Uncharacterized protein n=1 Tax=Araneus ventricosus TaxID=182803 RepID=A0A4Y2AZE7_ARAVE|nr:hypothetical protein AVEN_183404-1 [Araneus ventricosus]